MKIGKTSGGVTSHAVKQLKRQYNFTGSDSEARSLLRDCKKIGDRVDRVSISSEGLKLSKGQFEKWNIPDGQLFAVIIESTVVTVEEEASYSQRRLAR